MSAGIKDFSLTIRLILGIIYIRKETGSGLIYKSGGLGQQNVLLNYKFAGIDT